MQPRDAVSSDPSMPPLTPQDAPRRATGDIPLSWAMPAEAVSQIPTSVAPAPGRGPVVVIAAAAAVVLAGAGGWWYQSRTMTTTTAATTTTTTTAAATTTTTTTTSTTSTTGRGAVEPDQLSHPIQPVAAAEAALDASPGAPPAGAEGSLENDVAPGGLQANAATAPENVVKNDVPTSATAAAEAPAMAASPAAATPARDPVEGQRLIKNARIIARDGDDERALKVAEAAVIADPACADCWKTVGLLRFRTGDRPGAALARTRAKALAGEAGN